MPEQPGDDISKVLAEAGENFIYRVTADPNRNYGRVRVCSCVDPIYSQPNPDCPICFGTGELYDDSDTPYKDFTVRGYFWHVESAQFWARVGQLERGDIIIYFSLHVPPRTGDIVLKSGSFWGQAGMELAILNVAPSIYAGNTKFYECHSRPRIHKSPVEK